MHGRRARARPGQRGEDAWRAAARPAPTTLLPREVDALYDALGDGGGARLRRAVVAVAETLDAVRQRSILFCDDDVIAVLKADYDGVKEALPDLLARAGGGVRGRG